MNMKIVLTAILSLFVILLTSVPASAQQSKSKSEVKKESVEKKGAPQQVKIDEQKMEGNTKEKAKVNARGKAEQGLKGQNYGKKRSMRAKAKEELKAPKARHAGTKREQLQRAVEELEEKGKAKKRKTNNN